MDEKEEMVGGDVFGQLVVHARGECPQSLGLKHVWRGVVGCAQRYEWLGGASLMHAGQ